MSDSVADGLDGLSSEASIQECHRYVRQLLMKTDTKSSPDSPRAPYCPQFLSSVVSVGQVANGSV